WRTVAKRFRGGVDERLESVFVLHEEVPRLPWQITECAEQDHCLDITVPIGRRVELQLDIAKAAALQDQALVAQGTPGLNGGVDVAVHVEEIVRVDGVVVLAS